MRKLINKITGTDMWVADNRVDEYLAAGHKLAANPEKPIMNEPVEEAEEEPVKKPAAKRRKR